MSDFLMPNSLKKGCLMLILEFLTTWQFILDFFQEYMFCQAQLLRAKNDPMRNSYWSSSLIVGLSKQESTGF